jgi:Uma2 family endonuclease
MTIREPQTAVEAFDAYAAQPDNADRILEFIGGEILDVPSNAYVSKIAILIAHFIMTYLMKNDIGHVTGEAGGYMVGNERFAPDVAFISYEKQPELVRQDYNPNPPDLAVEIISEGSREEMRRLTKKVASYNTVGTVVWVVDTEAEAVDVYVPGQAPTTISKSDEKPLLDGGELLPKFTLDLTNVFK